MHLRTIALAAGVLALLAGSYALTGKAPAAPQGKTIINVWYPWPADQGEEFRRLVNTFNDSSPDIFVRLLYVPNNLSSNQKLFLSISAGMPPDCTFVDGPQVCEWAARGAITPIDELMARYEIKNEDFWGPCWKQCCFHEKTYALTYCADPNFAFFWNRAVFREAGFPDTAPPRTIEEMDELSRKMSRVEPDGRLSRIGFIPWSVYGFANSLFTWGWSFGGEFYDEKTERVTCFDDPHVLEALNWMKSYVDEYGYDRLASLMEGFGDHTDNPFIRGRMAMSPGHVSSIKFFKKYAPNMDYGATAFPYPTRMGSDQSAWMGGWCMAIPRGSRHPEESFKFMKWMCTSDAAGRSMIATTGTFPAYVKSSAFELVKGDEKLEIFYEVLKNTRHQRPVMPAQAYYMGALERATNHALVGVKSPEQALRDAQEDTQKELDRVLGKTAATP